MRRLAGFCLVLLVIIVLAYCAIAPSLKPTPPVKPPTPQPPVTQQATPEQCQADAYSLPEENAGKYSNGATVTNKNQAEENHAYTCTVAGWCNQHAYAPGRLFNGAENWPAAWTDLGACAAQPQTNTLELSFATVVGKVPFRSERLGVGPQAASNLQVSGVLRCRGREDTPFSGPSDQTLTLHDLAPCNYDLVMDAAQGYLPLGTPVQVEFKADEPQTIALHVKYRQPLDVSRLLPLPGVKVEVFASGLYQPRQMAMGNKVLYVGSSAIPSYAYDEATAGSIYAIPLDAAGKPSGVYVLASGLEEPHGVVYRDGDLYFSTSGKLYRVRNVDQNYQNAHPEAVLDFPADEPVFPLQRPGLRIWHQKHPLHFNAEKPTDKALYTAVGIPCNLCMIPPDERYGTLLRYDLGTGTSRILAKGIRNAVGFAWHPEGSLWFTDNNRQGFLNTDEVNVISQASLVAGKVEHFGVPYLFGHDTLGFTAEEFLEPDTIQPPLVEGAIVSDRPLQQIKPEDYQPPAYELGSNTAPLGISFWTGYPAEPGRFANLLVAVHGTGTEANRGMELRMLTVKEGREVVNQIPLVTGWAGNMDDFNVYCLDDSCLGRPTDLLTLDDGSLLVSDDLAGVIYRITFDESQQAHTTLVLKPVEAPKPEVRPLMISGILTDNQGRARRFDVAWGETPLILRGLAQGQYTLRLNNVGDLIPTHREQQVDLTASATAQVELGYRERPPFTPVRVTLTAPSKPDSATEQWDVTLVSDGKPQVVHVPWGGTQVVELPMGQHAFNFPYYQNELPEPTQQVLNVDEESTAPVTVQMQYQQVAELGRQLVQTTCATCHTVQYFYDANKAINWSLAGREALIQQIRGMTVKGHCDASCSGQIADYFYNDLWANYLDPQQAYGKRQLRLLTRDEYANSVRDLFGVAINQDALPADKNSGHFKYPGDADAGLLQADDVKSLYDMAWKVAEETDANSLAQQSVAQLGRRVFRRPLDSNEVQRYESLRSAEGDQALVVALLLSPNYLYRSELGEASGKAGLYQLTAYERATALSYTLLGTTPSDALMQQAEQGQLQTPEQVGAIAQQLLTSAQGETQFNRFISYYLRTYRGSQTKPGLDDATIQSMAKEQALLVAQVIKDGGSFNELFNPGYSFLDQDLAQHYGIAGVSGSDMRKVEVNDKRGGLLHLGITQVVNSDYQATSLVKRGIMIREQMLCREFGVPVEPDPTEPEFPDRAISTRERWELVNGKNASEGRCWQCHQYMNDTGFSMEHYDASGRYRDTEKAYNHAQFPEQVPINASGPFISNTAVENWADITSLRDVAHLLPSNTTAQTCMADSYLRFMFGTKVSAGSVGALKSAAEVLADKGSLIQMVRELATSPAFLNRKEEN